MDTLTTEQAAARLGVTPSRVRVLIRSGRLPAQKFGRAHVINEADLKLVAERPVGRPPSKSALSTEKRATGRSRASTGTSTGQQKGKK